MNGRITDSGRVSHSDRGKDFAIAVGGKSAGGGIGEISAGRQSCIADMVCDCSCDGEESICRCCGASSRGIGREITIESFSDSNDDITEKPIIAFSDLC